ncbi:MAG: phosphoribosylanthranilate isomerase, partial [Methylacidiphilales bacterium]|nr:phosphoribosylanthranilate isomerase [Candidatus Methylacidiphilales bacterium]
MKIKICGITNKLDAFAAVDLGADALGFIIYEKSKRYIEPDKAIELARQLPPFVQRVAVTVDMAPRTILDLDAERAFDAWQLHGAEKPQYCEKLKPLRLIKALGFPLIPGVKPDAYDVDAF